MMVLLINTTSFICLGNSNPVVTGGAGLTVKWKQLSLSAFHGRFWSIHC